MIFKMKIVTRRVVKRFRRPMRRVMRIVMMVVMMKMTVKTVMTANKAKFNSNKAGLVTYL